MTSIPSRSDSIVFLPSILGYSKAARWLLVKLAAQTPPAPSEKSPETGASDQIVAFGASPCLDALAAYLLRHRLCAQPNCLRCAPQAGGFNFLVLPVREPWAIVRAEVHHYPLAVYAFVRKWLKRKAAFRLLRPRKAASGMPEGVKASLIGLSIRSLPQNAQQCQTTPEQLATQERNRNMLAALPTPGAE